MVVCDCAGVYPGRTTLFDIYDWDASVILGVVLLLVEVDA